MVLGSVRRTYEALAKCLVCTKHLRAEPSGTWAHDVVALRFHYGHGQLRALKKMSDSVTVTQGSHYVRRPRRDGRSFQRETRDPYRTFWSSSGLLRFLGPFLDYAVDVHHQEHHLHGKEAMIP